ncbi:hypothetical protein BLNAU_25215 [Blattamonas nauphoetae]|uniref:Uncharacterized protein n=1 Tax=Blattamonas nauphoetae TaxID=2049346 RepID=A0ABQ9WK76_9EUKA|nr:hypothetical protein BLNAU_25215 [Blattamonas nauphoetae]
MPKLRWMKSKEESDWDVPGEEEAEAEGLAKKERLESTRPRLIVETHFQPSEGDGREHERKCVREKDCGSVCRGKESGRKGRDETQGHILVILDYFTVASDDDNIEITEPNNLWMFERSGHNGRNGEYTRELTESSTLSFTETAITLAIPQKEIAASIAVEAEWHARLVFGDGSRTESFRVKLSGSDERKH